MRDSRRRAAITAVLATSILAVTAGQASAATVAVESLAGLDTVVFRAAPGEANRVSAGASPGGIVIADVVALTPGAGCSRPTGAGPTRVVCRAPRGATPLAAFLGDLDDSIAPLPVVVETAELEGGTGDDTLSGSAGEDRISGGPGNDSMSGLAADDKFLSPTLDGADTMDGGRGIGDAVDYEGRTANLIVLLDGLANDGETGEGDNVGTGMEDVFSGSGDDTISSFTQPSTLRGGAGADVMRGGVNTDELLGGPGPDRLSGGGGSDRVEGESGNDRLVGGRGDDLMRGNSGNDFLRARDGFIDRVGCGTGRDTIVVDRSDMAFSPCERVRRNGAAFVAPIGIEALPVGFARFASGVFDRNMVELQLGCPRDSRRRCVGTAVLTRRGQAIARTRFSIRRADRRQFDVRIPTRVARLVRRRGEAQARLVIRTVDSAGDRVRVSVSFTLYDEVPTL